MLFRSNGNGIPDDCDFDNVDCNSNGVIDGCDIFSGTSGDCNSNAVPDECEPDCNVNSHPDECDIAAGTSADCQLNGIPDECEDDCNTNGVADECDIIGGTSLDCNTDGIPDECELAGFIIEDTLENLNANNASISALVPTRFDFSDGATGTNIPDGGNDMYDGGNILNTDLATSIPYTNGVVVASNAQFGTGSQYFTAKYTGLFVMVAADMSIDTFQITGNNGADGGGIAEGGMLSTTRLGRSFTIYVKRVYNASDPSINHIIIVPGDGMGINHTFATNTDDDLDTLTGLAGTGELFYILVARQSGLRLDDADVLNIVDAFLLNIGRGGDCNTNGFPDDCDIAAGSSEDCDLDGVPDECDAAGGTSPDCNTNSIPDECDTPDCNGNSVPDSCDVVSGTSSDCNTNGIPDECDAPDCNTNGIPDSCDVTGGTSPDCNANGIPDACDLGTGVSFDCNFNNVPDECDTASGTSEDCQSNSVPDECELLGGNLDVDIAVDPPLFIANTVPPAVHTHSVAQAGVVGDVNVDVTLNHTYVADLAITVEHLGVTVLLFNHSCGSNDNFAGTVFDDEAAGTIQCSFGQVGTFRPAQPLSALDGLPVAGDWTLTVADTVGGDSGKIGRASCRERV